jgi:hypothetical protein
MSVTTTVTNSGPAPAGAFLVGILAIPSGDQEGLRLLGTRTLTGLAPGASSTAATTVTIPANLPRGTYTIGAVADSAGALNELSLDNNPDEASATTTFLDCGTVSGSRSVSGTITVASQPNAQFSGTAVLSSPGSPSLTLNLAALHGSVDVAGQIAMPGLAFTANAGTIGTGTLSLSGTESEGVLSLDVTGQSTANGGQCTFSGQLVAAPAARTTLSFQLAPPPASFAADALTPTVPFPVAVTGWAAQFKVAFDAPLENETTLPAASTVVFTSPGDALPGTPASDEDSDVGATSAVYASPAMGPQFNNGSVATPPGGSWTVLYKGANRAFTAPDPQAATRLVIPVPTAVVDDAGRLTRVNWSYRNRSTGAVLAAPPTFMLNIGLELESNGNLVYASGPLPVTTRSIPVL